MSAAEERRWLLKALPYAQDAVSDLSQMFTEDMPFYVSRDPLTQTQVHADSIILDGFDARSSPLLTPFPFDGWMGSLPHSPCLFLIVGIAYCMHCVG